MVLSWAVVGCCDVLWNVNLRGLVGWITDGLPVVGDCCLLYPGVMNPGSDTCNFNSCGLEWFLFPIFYPYCIPGLVGMGSVTWERGLGSFLRLPGRCDVGFFLGP
jgi:hypothetical protein